MAKYYNPGYVNLDQVRKTTFENGGGETIKMNDDGSEHHTLWDTNANQVSYDKYDDDSIQRVHTSYHGNATYEYKGGYEDRKEYD